MISTILDTTISKEIKCTMASWDGTVVTSELKLKTRWSLIQAKKIKYAWKNVSMIQGKDCV